MLPKNIEKLLKQKSEERVEKFSKEIDKNRIMYELMQMSPKDRSELTRSWLSEDQQDME